MTALEKFKRLMSPQCAADYGLSVSLPELLESGEGREWALMFFVQYIPADKWPDDIKEMLYE